MAQVKKFIFNPFQENTYVLYDSTGDCVIVDPGCYTPDEEEQLTGYLSEHGLLPVRLLLTHCHVDHVLGNNFVSEKFNLKPEIHPAGLPFLENAHEHAKVYGFEMDPCILPEKYIEEDDEIRFGNTALKAVYTPGHADGSVCFIDHSDRFVLSGDVLFRDSIGRTDFPTGDYSVLMKSIHTHLFVLDDDYTVFSGHGPETTIGHEKVNNPFIRY
jgi:glyoxylase-like metal-dependent hydrolase (beta-lactamase superfamily II)